MHSLLKYARTALSLAFLLSFFGVAHADGPRGDVGTFDANGTLKLDLSRFQDKFPDGLPVAEVKVEVSNGFLYLTRKGYASPTQSCRRQAVQILNAAGQPVVVGSMVPGQHGWIVTGEAVNMLACTDDGCHALKWVVPIGAPPLRSARCDVSELSGNHCKCHLDDGSGVTVTNGDFCNSFTEVDSLIVAQWMKLASIQN